MFTLLLAAAAAAGTPGFDARHGLDGGEQKLSVPRPAIRNTGVRPNLAIGQMYTINSVGAPSSRTYSSSSPVAFNNAGEILGQAFDISKNASDCVVYTGPKKFVDITQSTNYTTCYAQSLSNVAAGSSYVVGLLDTPFETSNIAFMAKLQGSAGTLTKFTSNSPSGLSGVNLTGEAVGSAWYRPVGGFFYAQPPFVLPAPGQALTVMQPTCTSSGTAGCGFGLGGPCPFGGCEINDSGSILALDEYASTPTLMTYTYGTPGSVKDIPLSVGVNALVTDGTLNNAGQILYSGWSPTNTSISSYVYAGSTGTTTQIPTIPGNTCTYYIPVSLSNAGQVLGYTGNCGTSSDSVYWTWDPVNGIQDLNAAFSMTGYSKVFPLGINDNGQILVQLFATTGNSTWGTLNPPPASSARPHLPSGYRRH